MTPARRAAARALHLDIAVRHHDAWATYEADNERARRAYEQRMRWLDNQTPGD